MQGYGLSPSDGVKRANTKKARDTMTNPIMNTVFYINVIQLLDHFGREGYAQKEMTNCQ